MSGSRPTVTPGPAVVPLAGSSWSGQSDGDPVAPGDRSSDPAGATVIVGRETELARLRELRDAAFAGQARTVLIAGEAGVGKTSVTEAFVAATRQAESQVRVLRGECVPLGGEGLPYAPVVGLLHDLADQLGEAELLRLAGAGAAELRWLIPEFGTDGQSVDGNRPENRLRLFETIARLIEETARRTPVIMIVEDLHWADESSRHVIEFLIRSIVRVPVLIMISYRTDELTRRHPLRPFLAEIGRVPSVQRVEIGRLTDAQVDQLINLSCADPACDHDQHPELLSRLTKASGGIPYFVVELVRASHAGGDLPQTLRDTLLARIWSVGEDCQRLLRLMAVGGNRVEHTVIAAVSGFSSDLAPDELESLLREAIDAQLLVPDRSGYAFRHALMREVLHDDLLPGELTRLHKAYAMTLEDHPELMGESVRAVELAHHWYAARDNAAAFRWSVRAARLQRYGYAEALRLYERALELWEVVDAPEQEAGELPEFLDEASEAANNSGDVDRSLALINEALRIATDAPPEATALRLARKARRLLNLVQPGVLELINEAVALVPPDPPSSFRARLLDSLASMHLLLDKPASIASARAAIEAARAVGDRDIESSARNTLGCALATLGIDPDGGLEQLRRAGELAVSIDTRIRYYINMSDTLNLLGRHREAVGVALQGRALAAEVGRDRHFGIIMDSNAAEALIAEGDWAGARTLVEKWADTGTAISHWIQNRRLVATATLWMDDDLERAQELLDDLGQYSSIESTGPQYHVGIQFAEAELALARNEPETAWRTIRSVVGALHWSEPGFDLALLALAAAAFGQTADRPKEWAEWITEQVRLLPDFPVSTQWLPFIEAELDGSVDRWQQAVESMIIAKTPPHMIAYGYFRLAERQAAAGLHAESRRTAQVARDRAEELGVRLLLRWLDEAGFGRRLTVVARDSELPVLTAREQEVLALVAEGLSNRQIGDRLVISAKTASVHVSNILAKLGVSGRGEAAARFRRDHRP